MRTVKEISDLTGISVRTLHYYDEIGLLKPTEKSDAGYRLYDDKALETLQQILFFREFDISLKEIKAVLDNPALERNQILQVQRKMLVTKKERMERLIASIDDILKGENKMDFTIFTKTEVEEMFQTMLEHMPENMRNIAIKEFGSIEQWKKHYMEVVSSEEMQKGYNHKNTDKNKQNDRNQHDTGYPDVQYHQQDFHTQRYSEAGNNLWNVMGVKCLQLFHIVHNDRFDLPGCRCFHIAHW